MSVLEKRGEAPLEMARGHAAGVVAATAKRIVQIDVGAVWQPVVETIRRGVPQPREVVEVIADNRLPRAVEPEQRGERVAPIGCAFVPCAVFAQP